MYLWCFIQSAYINKYRKKRLSLAKKIELSVFLSLLCLGLTTFKGQRINRTNDNLLPANWITSQCLRCCDKEASSGSSKTESLPQMPRQTESLPQKPRQSGKTFPASSQQDPLSVNKTLNSRQVLWDLNNIRPSNNKG